MLKPFKIASVFLLLSFYTLSAFSAHTHIAPIDHHLRLLDHPTTYLGDGRLPSRTPPLEWGSPFLAPGKIAQGHVIKTGAIINPRLWVYGTLRTAFQTYRTGAEPDSSEWANRIDLFANLQLTETMRVLLHLRPLNKNNDYTAHIFRPKEMSGYQDEFNLNITQLFIEFDVGELFPKWQSRSCIPRDIGFAIGRQQIFYQEGILINDFIDAISITQNSLAFPGVNNCQLTTYLGVNNRATIIGLHSSIDRSKHSFDIDAAYLRSQEGHCNLDEYPAGNLLALAISSVQRIGHWGISARVLGSLATASHTPQADDGLLLFFESNRECGIDHDIFYINTAITLGHFTSIARDPTVAGPLGSVGILFAGTGVGGLGSAINSQANNCVAAAFGYQKFFDCNWQGIVEIGSRINTRTSTGDSIALGGRLQRGIGKRCVIRFDAFVGERNALRSIYGLRTEFVIKL